MSSLEDHEAVLKTPWGGNGMHQMHASTGIDMQEVWYMEGEGDPMVT
jgi:hypothetical protein